MKLRKIYPMLALLILVVMAGCNKKDIIPGIQPKVTSTNPIKESTGIAINSDVSAMFSLDMDPSTITTENFVLKQGTTNIEGAVAYSGSTATFNPTTDLTPNTSYTATISTGAKEAEEGLSLAIPYSWSFTTGGTPDIIKPTVSLTDPLNNAVGVVLNKQVKVTFSEVMDPTSVTSLTYNLKQGTTSVAGTVTYTGSTATFTPTANLLYGKIYTGTITTGAKDLSGNTIAAIYTFSFTTINEPDLALPMVSSTNPLNNASLVVRNKVVTATFSEAMDASTINGNTFSVKQGTTIVPGTVTYTGTIASFTSTNIFEANTLYTATITTGVKDLAGNALASNLVWSFTTVATTATLPVVNLRAAGNYIILAKTAITNISTSAITGDLGLSPAATSYITGLSLTNATGYATSAQVTGQIFAADMAAPTGINLTTAVEDMITAYNDAAGRPDPDFLELATGNIGGRTLTPGLYKWTTNVTMPSDVTISGGANDVWIFQISENLLMSNGVRITLTGGAQAKNIFWQVAGQATFGTTSHFEGIILSMTGITLQTGSSLKGRALAQTAVVLDGSTLVLP